MLEYLQDLFGPLATAIGTVVLAGGGLVTLTYGLFRFFGERWLNTKFEERLAAYRHAQQKALEHLRFEINALMDRTIKLHQREFEILPEAWSLLNDAYWSVRVFMSLQSYPDINRWNEVQLDEFLEKSSMAKWEKDELKKESDKTRYYIKHVEWNKIREARKSYGELQIYLLKNGIFIPPDIKKEFSELDNLIRGALVEHELRKEEGSGLKYSDMKDFRRMMDEGQILMKRLESTVQKRLWISSKITDETSERA